MKHLRLLTLSLCVVALNGCQTFDGVMKDIESIKLPALNNSTSRSSEELVYSGNCPSVEAVEELSSLSEFSDTSDQNAHNLISSIEIADMQSSCNYDERSVTIDLRMDFTGNLGPRGQASSSFSYPFFVAVTSARGDILAKEIFAAPITYGPGQRSQTYTEKMRQIIPIENRDRGSKYKVLVGLQLTPDQLAYNRRKIVEERARIEAENKLLREAEKMKKSEFEQKPIEMQTQAQKEIYIGRPVDITP